MAVSDLTFDCKNPRLPEFGLTKNSTEAEVIKVLWTAMDVRELVMSIAASGFLRHEPLIVAVEDGKNVVIEGNRRLAAVKVLVDPAVSEPLSFSCGCTAARGRRDPLSSRHRIHTLANSTQSLVIGRPSLQFVTATASKLPLN